MSGMLPRDKEFLTLVLQLQVSWEEASAMCLWLETEEMEDEAIAGLQELIKKEPNPDIHQIRKVVGDIVTRYFPPYSPGVITKEYKLHELPIEE